MCGDAAHRWLCENSCGSRYSPIEAVTYELADPRAVDVRDHARRIMRRWPAIAIATILSALFGLVVSALFPKIYETELDLVLAQVLDDSIEDPYQAAAFLQSAALRSQLPAASAALGSRLLSVEVVDAPAGPNERRAIGLLRITVRGRTPEDAVQAAVAIRDVMMARHDGPYRNAAKQADDYRATLETHLRAILDNDRRVEQTVSTGRAARDEAAALGALLVSQDRHEQVIRLSKELRDFRIQTTKSTRPTAALAIPTTPTRPVWPRPFVFATVAAVLGLAMAIAATVAMPVIWLADGDAHLTAEPGMKAVARN